METPEPVAERTTSDTFFLSLRNFKRSSLVPELIAGVTLIAIAVPEQIATAQLADVPAFLALMAFMAATLAFAMFGSNPIISIGADSTIAPLFSVALIRLAVPSSTHYLELVSATAVVAGLLLVVVGIFRLGWLADFLSAPIIAGFMTGIGLTIIVHQLPHALGIPSASGTFMHRLYSIWHLLGQVNGWSAALAFGTLFVVVVGERISPKLPFALGAISLSTIVTHFAHLANHGVATLGRFAIEAPAFRLSHASWHDFVVIFTTAATIAIVILSQSAATSRDVADELGVNVNINRDFMAIGLANVASGLVGTIPVNASPPRTNIVRFAGGRTQLVGIVAAVGALLVIPFAFALRDMPLASLAGVLFYVAARLLKVTMFRQIGRVDRYELALAGITGLAVILIGVQEGIAVAVLLAIIDQTRRSARPRAVVLGRRPESTSWVPIGEEGATRVDSVTVFLFAAPLYFANAALFRTEIHAAMRRFPDSAHLVVDAAAITDVDFTGLHSFAMIVADLKRDHVDVVVARANHTMIHALARAPSTDLNELRTFATVDDAVRVFSD